MNTPPASLKCNNIASLKAYLAGFPHELNHKPNGQSMYTFKDKLVLNVYDTGTVVFQGTVENSPFADQIRELINQINKPIEPKAP